MLPGGPARYVAVTGKEKSFVRSSTMAATVRWKNPAMMKR